VEFEHPGLRADGNGYVASAGVRGKPTDLLEFNAAVNYANIEDEGEAGYSFGARFFVAPKASFGATYGSADDVDTIGFDVRFDI